MKPWLSDMVCYLISFIWDVDRAKNIGGAVEDPGGGGASNMKYKAPKVVPIFLWLVLTGTFNF